MVLGKGGVGLSWDMHTRTNEIMSRQQTSDCDIDEVDAVFFPSAKYEVLDHLYEFGKWISQSRALTPAARVLEVLYTWYGVLGYFLPTYLAVPAGAKSLLVTYPSPVVIIEI